MLPKPITWTTEQIRLGNLIEWEHNPVQLSKHDSEQIQISLEKFGFVLPLVANQPKVSNDSKRRLIDGHQRKTILVFSKIANLNTKIDVRVPSRKLTDYECDELSIRLRRNTGSFDYDILSDEFDINDLLEWGFENRELEILPKDIDFEIPLSKEDNKDDQNEITVFIPSDIFLETTTYLDKLKRKGLSWRRS